ncbi:MAG TPA: hypothetical protein VGX68_11725 [Thermoanaerobaculia bacterium]|jgi:hypothetical protein|nr:hypothetical protein [Thermoanaerobaculia bacterium]
MVKAVFYLGRALAAFCLTAPAWAVPTPQGVPFRASSCTNCRQEEPSVAGAASGAYLVVWEGSTTADLRGINGRLFTNAGAPQAADFAVAKKLAPDQYDAAVTRDSKGNYIAVWSQVEAGNSEIMAQRFKPNGTVLGAAFKVNQDTAGTPTIPADFNPAVARTNDGGFVVVWMNLLPSSPTFPGTNPQVLARRFNAAGAPLGSQLKLNTGLVHGDRPDVCVDSVGQTVAVWTTVDAFRPFQANYKGISYRRLTAAGALIGTTETVVAQPVANSARGAVSCGSGGTYVVVWHSDQAPAADRTDILGQRFSRLGRKVGPVFRVNSTTTRDQKNPSISHDPQGRFIVVWQSDLDGTRGIFGREFTAAGAAVGTDFAVLSEKDDSTPPINPDVTHVGTAGNFVVVWQNGTEGTFGRRFTP